MPIKVKIIECPRDAWQSLPSPVVSQVKAEYLRMLIEAGFHHIDAVSFVSPAAVPQMADAEQVLTLLEPGEQVEIIGIVVNRKGVDRAIRTGAVSTLGFPYSVSSEFLRRNQNQTLEESIDTLEAVVSQAESAQLGVIAYLSMAFGNPYGEKWSIDEVVDACDLLVDSGVRQISLADTVGISSAEHIGETFAAVSRVHHQVEFGVHLHSRPDAAAARIRAAWDAGCRRFDSTIGGLGGCPFAQDALVGNIPTEILVKVLGEAGAELPALRPLDDLIRANARIAAACSVPVQ